MFRISRVGHSNIIKAKELRAIRQVGDENRHIHDIHGWDKGPRTRLIMLTEHILSIVVCHL
jgi:hypothetical protein